MKRTLFAAAALATALTLGACSGMADLPAPKNAENPTDKSAPGGLGPEQVDGQPPTSTEPPDLPTPKDFELEVTVLSEQCFGSAGCNVTFRVTPTIVGAFDDDAEAMVIYEVTGGESPITNSFELLGGGEYRYQPEETASTPSADVDLTAEVVNVIEN